MTLLRDLNIIARRHGAPKLKRKADNQGNELDVSAIKKIVMGGTGISNES